MKDIHGPPSAWYDPPIEHELDTCERCHDADGHQESQERWADRGCVDCEDKLDAGVASGDYCTLCKMWYCDGVHVSSKLDA